MIRKDHVFLTSGMVHPGLHAQLRAYRLCHQLLGGELQWIRGFQRLTDLNSAPVRLCVAYFHHKRDHAVAASALSRHVSAGGALVALHGASASFKGNAQWEDLLGGVFTGHGRICAMTLDCTEHPSAILDEPYRHRISGEVDVICRWSRMSTASAREHQPAEGVAAWKRTHGTGRVGYLALGHLGRTWMNADVRALLSSLVAWCLGGDDT